MAVIMDPAHLDIVRNVAPDEILADGIPGRAFGPEHSRMQPLNRRVAELALREPGIEDDDVRIGIPNRLGIPTIVSSKRDAGGARGECAEKRAASELA